MGRIVRIYVLFCLLLEPVDRLIQSDSALSSVAAVAADADAAVALPSWSRALRAHRREQANIHSGPRIFAWCLVLLPGPVFLEIASGVSAFAHADRWDC